MLVKCECKSCKNCINGMCQADVIEIVDVEEKESIKMKENDFAVCKTFKGVY